MIQLGGTCKNGVSPQHRVQEGKEGGTDREGRYKSDGEKKTQMVWEQRFLRGFWQTLERGID